VRFLLGDTDDTDHQMEDEEIDYLVTTYGDATVAAAAGARALAGKYARLVSKAVGDLKLDLSDRTAQYRDLAGFLSSGAGGAGSTVRPKPVAMGITHTQKDAAEDELDRVAGAFAVGMDDFDRELSQEEQNLGRWV